MPSRRRFLVLLPAFAATTRLLAYFPSLRKKKAAPPAPLTVYFGTDTGKGVSKGIYQATFDTTHGKLTPPVLAVATARPSFMALSRPGPNRRLLYAVNGLNDGNASVTTFTIDAKTAALHQAGQVPSGGAGPTFISIDDTNSAAFVANYMGSTIASFRIQSDGTLTHAIDCINCKDTKEFGALGPVSARQDVPHPHCATLSPDNRFLLVCDLGTDKISVFLVHPETGQITDHKIFTNDRPGSGPRHIVFHPNGRWVYNINELDSSIDRYLWTATRFSDVPQGLLVNTNSPIKTIAPDFPAAKNTAAELTISPDGAFLYASNRGEDSLVVFTISPKDGNLKFFQRISCGGKTPRHFTLDPTAMWLVCGNQDSATITIFRRDTTSGQLSGPIQTVALDSPLFTLFA
jgi:6-phosphogluconolactonase